MSPLPAIFALEDAQVYIHFSNSDNVSSNVKVSIDQHFTILSTLSVLNIDQNDSYIRLGRGLYKFWF